MRDAFPTLAPAIEDTLPSLLSNPFSLAPADWPMAWPGPVALLLIVLALLAAWRARTSALRERMARVQAEHESLLARHAEQRDRCQQLTESQALLRQERDALSRREAELLALLESTMAQRREDRERLDALQRRADAAVEALAKAREQLGRHDSELAAQRARLAERERGLEETRTRLEHEFDALASRIFEQRGRALAEQQSAAVNAVLAPVRAQLGQFRARLDEVHDTDGRERASLLSEVRNLQRASARIDREAGNLVRALKGDKRLQGNWGEMVLERLLERSGLQRGREFDTQQTVHDTEGARRRPDVTIHLPGGREVFVDAKVSLLAWERAVAATEPAEREQALQQLVLDLRAQVRRLAAQDYDALLPGRSLDLVLLFVPVEPALHAAMERDDALYGNALDQRIMLVSPSTLMLALRIIEQVWRTENQSRHAREISEEAGRLHDKFVGFVADLEDIGQTLERSQRAHQAAMNKLATGAGNLVRRSERLLRLGVKARRQLPESLREAATAAAEDGDGTAVTTPASDPEASA